MLVRLVCLIFFLTITLFGCATVRVVDLPALVAEADRNEIAAAQLAREAEVVVAGRVLDFSYKKTTGRVARSSGAFVGNTYFGSTRTHSYSTAYPYVAVEGPSKAVAYCYVDPELPAVAALTRGQVAKLRGQFQSLQRVEGQLQVVIINCKPE